MGFLKSIAFITAFYCGLVLANFAIFQLLGFWPLLITWLLSLFAGKWSVNFCINRWILV